MLGANGLRIWVVDEDKKLLIWEGIVKIGENIGMSQAEHKNTDREGLWIE